MGILLILLTVDSLDINKKHTTSTEDVTALDVATNLGRDWSVQELLADPRLDKATIPSAFRVSRK